MTDWKILNSECLPPHETTIWSGAYSTPFFAHQFIGDGLAQFGRAGGGGILGIAVLQRRDARVFDVLGRIEIGFADIER